MAPEATSLQQSNSNTIKSTLNYYLDPELGGHTSYYTGTAGYYRRKFDEHVVKINDARGREDDFSLNTHGFQYHRHTSAEKDFLDDNSIKEIVYPETENLIKEITGATRVHTFSHIIRRTSREDVQNAVNNDPSLADDSVLVPYVTPARFIHIDFSNDGAVEILNDNFPDSLSQELKKTRWSIINVWRPIKPISKDPLALCDALTVRDEDLMPVSVTLPSKGTGQYSDISKGDGFELYYLRYDPKQTWYYVSAMKPEEVLLLKCYDSIRDGRTARRVPHSAFTNPDTKDDVNRESIEVRCLVFYEDQPN